MIFSLFFLLAGSISLILSLTGTSWPLMLSLATLAMGGILWMARSRDAYIRVIITLLAATHLILTGLIAFAQSGQAPESWANYIPPVSMPIGASVFALLILAISYIPVIGTITRISNIYFEGQERSDMALPFFGKIRAGEGNIGKFLFGTLIAINLFQVALNVRLSFFSRDLFNALADKNAADFWFQLLWVFVPLVIVAVGIAILEIVLQYSLRMRWREALNRSYVNRWLDHGTHYHMQLKGHGADNPDQRIADDLRGFVDQTYQLSIGILSQAATLVSFIVILWSLSQDFTLPGTDIRVPGLLVWFAICYAILGTWLTHLIGRPLIPLNFQQEKVEADYRFSLARLREYGEQIALMRGENAEKARLASSFSAVIANFFALADRQKKLTAFTASFFQASVVVPYIVAAPFYFLGKISLGQLQQTAGAFGRVDGALTYFIAAYSTLANFKAVIDRLTTFEKSLKQSSHASQKELVFKSSEISDLVINNLVLALPDQQVLSRFEALSFKKGESVLVTGPSGCGKSTLFRTVSGIWPYATGDISIPQEASLLFLPQRPYLPMGTLRAAIAYPALETTYSDEEIAKALDKVNLTHLQDKLAEEDLWSQTLSLGEQQRLAIARALLDEPDWLFLDEATAALDEPTESLIYSVLKSELPQTTLISIGHRSTLIAFHERRIEMEKIMQ